MGFESALIERLRTVILPPGAGADLSATNEHGLIWLEPLTRRGQCWLITRTSDEASWAGDALVIEPRFFPALAEAAIEAGLMFERDALPN